MTEQSNLSEHALYSLRETILHVAQSPIELSVQNTGCVDPRDSIQLVRKGNLGTVVNVDHSQNAVRRPGATVGYTMLLLDPSIDMTPQEAVGATLQFEKQQGRIPILHDDDDVSYDLGCGHINRAGQLQNEALYGIPSRKVSEMIDIYRHLVKSEVDAGRKAKDYTAKMHVPMLTGHHKENGVLVINSDDKTLPATIDGKDFFRYDRLADSKRIISLVVFLREQGIKVNEKKLQDISDRQTNATLQLLAPGLPVFEVDLTTAISSVKQQGFVPK